LSLSLGEDNLVRSGTLYGISVGTGDPELITVKGLRLLQRSPVVAFPQGVNDRLGIAETIISQWLQSEQVTLALHFPYVKDSAILHSAWQQAAGQVWQYLQRGDDVAFACLGDVSFYSTFTYLAETVRQLYDAPVVTVPGVCSPVAIASELNLPLTVNSQRLAILPAIYTIDELEKVLDWAEVVILLKVNSVYSQVWQVLQKRNLFKSSWIVEKATMGDRRIYENLEHYPQLKLSYFSVLMIQNFSSNL
jgi:precorrin-2/cobalt-factor-2 C20-methyltransferase